MYPERCVSGEGKMNLRLYKNGELVNESENSMTKGYSVLSLD